MLRKISLLIFILWIKIKQLFSFSPTTKHLLIIKIEAIGDYILFRNFARELKESDQYKHYKITLLGNKIWGELAVKYDSDVFDNIYLIDRNTLEHDWFKVFNYLRRINYDTVVSWNYSRNPITDIFSYVTAAKHKIAVDGDCNSISPFIKSLFNAICYNQLINVPSSIKSEFGYNKHITETLLKKPLTISKPTLEPLKIENDPRFHKNQNYVLLAPGAGVFNRKPTVDFLAQLTKYVVSKYPIYYIGAGDDYITVQQIEDKLDVDVQFKLVNLVGKTTLAELPSILKNARMVIANDSGIYHMAVAINKPVLCIAGGGHFERFVDYTENPNIKLCYEPMSCFNCDWNCIFNFQPEQPYPCIKNISATRAINDFVSLDNLCHPAEPFAV